MNAQAVENGYISIVVYKAHLGKEPELMQLLQEHLPVLRGQGLAAEREPIVLRAKDGRIVEIFEWKSAAAVEQAHHNTVVQEMWKKFWVVTEVDMLANLPEAQQMFSSFERVELP